MLYPDGTRNCVGKYLENIKNTYISGKDGFLKSGVEEDKKNAFIIQTFLQQIKRRTFDYYKKNPNRLYAEQTLDVKGQNVVDKIDDVLYQQYIDSLLRQFVPRGKTGKAQWYTIFGKTNKNTSEQGAAFERDLTNLFTGMALKELEKQKGKIDIPAFQKTIHLGAQQGHTVLNDSLLIPIGKQIKNKLKEGTAEEVLAAAGTHNGQQDAPGKIDVQVTDEFLYIIGQSKEIPTELKNALQGATFSLKSYRSAWFGVEGDPYASKKNNYKSHNTITLGAGSAYRGISGALSYFDKTQNDKSILSTYYASANVIAGNGIKTPVNYDHANHETVAKNLYLLRFIYELTGIGIKYSSLSDSVLMSQFARYLIYNDPATSGIWVVSTKVLLNRVFDDIFKESNKNLNPFQQNFEYAKSIIKELAY